MQSLGSMLCMYCIPIEQSATDEFKVAMLTMSFIRERVGSQWWSIQIQQAIQTTYLVRAVLKIYSQGSASGKAVGLSNAKLSTAFFTIRVDFKQLILVK